MKQVQSIVSICSFQRLEKGWSMVTLDMGAWVLKFEWCPRFFYTFIMRQRLHLFFFVLTRKKPASETFLQKPRWNWLCLGESVFGGRPRPSYWIIGLGKVESIHTKANIRCHCIALHYNGGQNRTVHYNQFHSVPFHCTLHSYITWFANWSHRITYGAWNRQVISLQPRPNLQHQASWSWGLEVHQDTKAGEENIGSQP